MRGVKTRACRAVQPWAPVGHACLSVLPASGARVKWEKGRGRLFQIWPHSLLSSGFCWESGKSEGKPKEKWALFEGQNWWNYIQIHLILKSVHGSIPDPLTLWAAIETTYSLWICISPEDLFPPVLGLSFANTRECGGEEGLGLNDHLLLVHQAFIEPPPCIKHSAWSWRYSHEINTFLLMRCLKAIYEMNV